MFNKFLMVLLLLSTSLVYSAQFTYNDNWSIPDNQKCDNWNTVSYYSPAVNPVIHAGETRKITLPVPKNSLMGYISFKGHASEPSKLITTVNHTEPFYIKNRLGSNVSASFAEPKVFLYVYHNAISQEVNKGPSTMFNFSATFKLTDAECARRGGDEPPKIIVPDLVVKPIILRNNFSFHLNQLELDGTIYAVSFEYSTNKDGVYYFKTTSLRPVVNGEDFDGDKYTILSGDCNDDDPLINPNNKNCN